LSEDGVRAAAPPLLEVAGLRKVFRAGSEDLTVLDGVSLAVREGSTVVISGESGSGKSTLLHLIGGLDSPTAGRIRFQELEISGLREAELVEYRNRRLLKDFTALENVFMPAAIGGFPAASARRRAARLLEQVGLTQRRTHYPSELSGGERQRVAVARALMNDPRLILADEPTGSLDERSSAQIRDLLFGLVGEYRKTMILVTHSRELAEAGDQQLVLEHGRLRLP
jgi:lipoprotein-releasing system ATP-binding protein